MGDKVLGAIEVSTVMILSRKVNSSTRFLTIKVFHVKSVVNYYFHNIAIACEIDLLPARSLSRSFQHIFSVDERISAAQCLQL